MKRLLTVLALAASAMASPVRAAVRPASPEAVVPPVRPSTQQPTATEPGIVASPQFPGVPRTPVAAPNGDSVRVYVMTFGPGDDVWEKFGHNAIWVHDPVAGTDQAYNYGMFDFRQENFVLRFVQGRMLYWMAGFDAGFTLDHYRQQNRDVWVQELNLTPAQRAELRDFLVWNQRDENRFYRYDYYRDNCSTRVRDAMDRVLHGALRARWGNVPTATTYRSHTERLTADDVPTYTGLMIGLAQPADRRITAWEEMFLPMRLRDYLRTAGTHDAAGRVVPLVRTERQMVQAVGRPAERTAPPQRIAWYLLAGVTIGGVIVLLGMRARRSGAARFGFAALASLWLILIGFGGLILLGLWTLTDHAIAYRNENLFQFDPVALPLILLVPCMAYGARWAARPAARIAVIAAALSVLGFALQALPWFYQVNGVVIALALPVHVALAYTALRLRDEVLAQPRPFASAPADTSKRPAQRRARNA
ncbi:MAG TPA: DUF4105 domain-containing protein [Longimicrobiaceae bacterium]|nr:DUF4105 domain-containing protein [Longimicrobiaceae bacterium]